MTLSSNEEADDVAGDVPQWSIRSALVGVADLDRSLGFYEDVTNLREILRADQMVVLGAAGASSFTLHLRSTRLATHAGQQAAGVRSLVFDVVEPSELDRVQARLQAHDLFSARQSIQESPPFELVHGHDPDRLSLTFVAYGAGATTSLDVSCRVMAGMYSVDL
jgi:catechol 2,3-dioxygenase-like lactoylglutathione lyase family enzyme